MLKREYIGAKNDFDFHFHALQRSQIKMYSNSVILYCSTESSFLTLWTKKENAGNFFFLFSVMLWSPMSAWVYSCSSCIMRSIYRNLRDEIDWPFSALGSGFEFVAVVNICAAHLLPKAQLWFRHLIMREQVQIYSLCLTMCAAYFTESAVLFMSTRRDNGRKTFFRSFALLFLPNEQAGSNLYLCWLCVTHLLTIVYFDFIIEMGVWVVCIIFRVCVFVVCE